VTAGFVRLEFGVSFTLPSNADFLQDYQAWHQSCRGKPWKSIGGDRAGVSSFLEYEESLNWIM
jgi:hypothetical protein